MKQQMHRIIVLLALALLAGGCAREDEPPAAPVAPPAPRATEQLTGETLFRERCRDCHKVGDKGGAIGPELTGIGATRKRAYLEQAIREPSKLYPGTVMPCYETFPDEQVDLLVEYLSGLR